MNNKNNTINKFLTFAFFCGLALYDYFGIFPLYLQDSLGVNVYGLLIMFHIIGIKFAVDSWRK